MTPETRERIEHTPRDYDGDVPDKLIARMARATGLPQLRLIADDVRQWLETGDAQPGDRDRLLAAYRHHKERLTGRTLTAKEARP